MGVDTTGMCGRVHAITEAFKQFFFKNSSIFQP